MSHIILDLSLDEVRTIVFQLPSAELLSLAEEIDERAETLPLMKLAETSFQEWNEPGEDLYDEQSPSAVKSGWSGFRSPTSRPPKSGRRW